MTTFKIHFQTPEMGKLVEKVLLDKGYYWADGIPDNLNLVSPVGVSIYCSENQDILHGIISKTDYEFKAETEFGKIIEFLNKKKVITIKLNTEYSAEVGPETTKVGCQTFDNKVILELAAAVSELNK